MVTRVSTPGNYSAVLSNLLAAQQRQMLAGEKVATQKNGSDLKDYARDAEMLTAMRSLKTRLEVYKDQNTFVSERLATQDTALNQVTDAAREARQAIADAIASGRVDTLMEDLQAQFRNAVEGMNARYGGKYVFAGGQVDTRPVSATSMSDLTSGPPIASWFENDQFAATAKVDEATTVKVGVLADDIGADLFTAFQTIQAFHESASGPFNGEMTAAQRTFLEGQLATWDGVREDLVNLTARNGLVQSRVEGVREDLTTRHNQLSGMMGDITDADMAEAVSQLEQAQLAVQSAAHVFSALQESSLLNILR
ncbi:flagellin [Phenylobacterium sp.]|uniref:flagellin n=1 Tax=Phenylobacterium sp. TaxID=1871053 RepID=UPI0028125491|nr:flagellin [Phenylobacterium sp.]